VQSLYDTPKPKKVGGYITPTINKSRYPCMSLSIMLMICVTASRLRGSTNSPTNHSNHHYSTMMMMPAKKLCSPYWNLNLLSLTAQSNLCNNLNLVLVLSHLRHELHPHALLLQKHMLPLLKQQNGNAQMMKNQVKMKLR